MLSAFCTASPGSLLRPAGPAPTALGAMALLSTYLFDACRLSNLVAGGRPAWRAAGSLLSTPWTVTSASLLLLQPPPGPALAATLRQCCLRLRHACWLAARVARGGPAWRAVVGSVPSRLCRAVCLTQGAAAAARGRHRRCCREHCRRVRHHRLSSSPISPTPLAARRRPALPCPALAQTNQHTHTHTHTHTQGNTPCPHSSAPRPPAPRPAPHASRPTHAPRPAPPRPSPCASRIPPHPLRHFSSPLLADSSSPRMIDDYPSFSDSSPFGANACYPFGPVRGRSGAIPTAGKVSERPRMRLHAGLLRRSLAPAPLPEDARRPG